MPDPVNPGRIPEYVAGIIALLGGLFAGFRKWRSREDRTPEEAEAAAERARLDATGVGWTSLSGVVAALREEVTRLHEELSELRVRVRSVEEENLQLRRANMELEIEVKRLKEGK